MCFVCNKDRTLDTSTWTSIFDVAYKSGMIFANLLAGNCF